MSSMVYIMFGGNIGDVEATFSAAEKYISERGFSVVCKSSIGSSAAVDCVPGTPDFKDMALGGVWNKSAEELLDLLQETERVFGRPADHRSDMSRTLDCDIIYFADLVINTNRLTVPHPRMHQRRFVLEVLQEIAPDVIHPVLHKTTKQLYCELPRLKNTAVLFFVFRMDILYLMKVDFYRCIPVLLASIVGKQNQTFRKIYRFFATNKNS